MFPGSDRAGVICLIPNCIEIDAWPLAQSEVYVITRRRNGVNVQTETQSVLFLDVELSVVLY